MRDTGQAAGLRAAKADPLAFLSRSRPANSSGEVKPATIDVSRPCPSLSLPVELEILAEAGIERRKLDSVLALAQRHNMAPAVVALRAGVISHQSYLDAIAASVGSHTVSDRALQALRPEPTSDPAVQTRLNTPVLARRVSSPHLPANLLLAPNPSQFAALAKELTKMGPHAGRIILVKPSSLRRWLVGCHAPHFADLAEHNFERKWPERSAKRTVTAGQGIAFLAILAAVVLAFALHSSSSSFVLHAICTLFFSSCVGFRVAVLISAFRHGSAIEAQLDPRSIGEAPIYTVLVALHDEANQASGLVRAISKLQWPTGRLEIKFITEADDKETVQALQSAINGNPRAAEMEILVVPDSELRTKPRALNYALPITTGEYVVLYDAEDRPDPGQLVEAHLRFQAADQRLACLQSPLAIANGGRGFLSMMFALEYAALFKVFLPAMARLGMAFPLGGTSNHFRGLM